MDYILVDTNAGNPIQCDNWKCADWLVFHATSMDDFASSWRVGNEDDEHINTKRILRCFAEIRTRYPNAKPGHHPYRDTEYKSGTGTRTAAVRREDGFYTVLDLDGIKSEERMEYQQMLWHVWVDFFLRKEPVAVWIAHARNLGKYFVENMQLPVEEAVAQKYERQGQAAIRTIEYKSQKKLEENGTDDNHQNGELVFNDRQTGEKINVRSLKACEIRVYPNPNWSSIKKWNPNNPFNVQEWLEFPRSWPISVI